MSRRADRRRAPAAPEASSRRQAARGRHAAPRGSGLGRTARRLLAPAVLVVLTIGVLMLGAFPTRTLLDQRRTSASAEARLQELEASNAAAQQEADALRTDAVIEQIARQEYGLAKPGEELYHVLPPAQDPVRVPEAWPFNALGSTLER
jgi:cell division protein FtsB